MKNRDDFPAEVIKITKEQAAYICSNPECRTSTIAPSLNDESMVQYIGKVAHISAAAPGGARYVASMSAEERMAVSNALFLCSNCADMIDKNKGGDYNIQVLQSWKEEHKRWVLANLNKRAYDADVVISSKYQQGGITAHIVNINSNVPEQDPKLLHDRQIFKKSEEIFNDHVMYRLYESLLGYAECTLEDINLLEHVLYFYRLPSNSYLTSTIYMAVQEFISTSTQLTKFINPENFDKWPYNQSASSTKIQLKPEYLRDTQYRQIRPGDREKWNELFDHLKKILNETKKCYDVFRKTVKTELHM